MLRWSLLLLFILGLSIQCAISATPLPPLNYVAARITFEHIKIDEKGQEIPENRTDYILSVVTGGGSIVGSAQSYCRHINPPAEQIILIKQAVDYQFFKNSVLSASVGIERPTTVTCAPLTYGCITLVHNYCSFTADLTRNNLAGSNAVLSKSSAKPKAGATLTAVYLDTNYKLQSVDVVVKDFKECEKQFDPEALYLVDAEEQLCTAAINPTLGNDPAALPTGLLFQKNGEKYNLIGIESKSEAGLSLSTFAPYHCKDFDKTCSA